MCGIVGIYRKKGLSEQDTAALNRALAALAARGPDAEGRFAGQQITLGHRRLAVIDPAHGAQPWIDPQSGVVLVYNGEIYNFREIRTLLLARQHKFTSNCDTEVLVKAYLEWGKQCIHKFRGIFAFCVFDPQKNYLWLARDHLGVKPLYYKQEQEGLIFASSVSALHEASSHSPRWHQAALSHYLMTVRTNLGRQTLFQDIYSLLPGEEMTLDLESGQLSRRLYWQLPLVPESEKCHFDFESAATNLRHEFNQITQEQLVSDVPLAGFLSGGLDSSILCASIQEMRPEKFHALSIGYDLDNYNEWDAMQITAQHSNLKWRKVRAKEEDFADDWARLIENKGLPLSTPNEIPIWRLSQAFRESFTVAMTGEGADEIFGGYAGPTFSALDYDRSLGMHGGVDPAALIRAYGTDQFSSRRKHFLHVNSWMKASAISKDFPGLSSSTSSPLSEVHAYYDSFFEQAEQLTTFDAYLHLHARINLEGLLNRLDSSTMLASVEGRVPFTDHRLAEKLFTMPDSFKMQTRIPIEQLTQLNSFEIIQQGQLETKRLLRAAFKDQVSPEILARKKVSFPVPFIEWFQTSLRPAYHEALHSSPLLRALLTDKKRLQLLNPEAPTDALLAWPLMNLALTEKRWNVS
jgi:asparagine synthase (glutamine-hydrolysing)